MLSINIAAIIVSLCGNVTEQFFVPFINPHFPTKPKLQQNAVFCRLKSFLKVYMCFYLEVYKQQCPK